MAWENCSSCELRENKYQAIYFSEWIGANNREEETINQQLGNHSARAASINLFISRLQKIKEMFLNGDLDQEMYDILLDKYVNDVPAK